MTTTAAAAGRSMHAWLRLPAMKPRTGYPPGSPSSRGTLRRRKTVMMVRPSSRQHTFDAMVSPTSASLRLRPRQQQSQLRGDVSLGHAVENQAYSSIKSSCHFSCIS